MYTDIIKMCKRYMHISYLDNIFMLGSLFLILDETGVDRLGLCFMGDSDDCPDRLAPRPMFGVGNPHAGHPFDSL